MIEKDQELYKWLIELPLELDKGVSAVEITPLNDRACQVVVEHGKSEKWRKSVFTADMKGAPKFQWVRILVDDGGLTCTIQAAYKVGLGAIFKVIPDVLIRVSGKNGDSITKEI